jgi:SpoVK/Ycf46/Vps4 family AAA+-type ATPase
VGKTMAAEAVASALDRDLYRVDLSATVSKYIGETEKALARIFDAAQRAGAVLLFDEADTLFGKRTEIRDSRDRWANMGVSYLLQRLETFGGICLLATNLKSQIDIGFLRRLRYVVDFRWPDAGLRREIWRRVIPDGVPVAALDYDRLAALDLAGGHIAMAAVNAAFLAADRGGPVGMDEIGEAAKAEYRKLDKPFPSHWQRGCR